METDDQVEIQSAKRPKRLRQRVLRPKTTKLAIVPRAISPLLGGTVVHTFDRSQPRDSSVAIEYCVKVFLPKLLPGQPDAWFAWVAAFCNSQPYHHVMHWACAVHRDLLDNKIAATVSPSMIRHKAEGLKELRKALDTNDFHNTKDRDTLLLTVMTLWANEIDETTFQPGPRISFYPHMPSANWSAIYGRTDYVETHAKAIIDIVGQIGGLQNIKLAGVAATMGLADLIQSSRWCQKPRFPRIWQYDSAVLLSHRLLHKTSGAPGRGFFVSVPGVLPSQALATYVRLATLDRKLEAWRKDTSQASENELRGLSETRNAIHHDLLSIPPWEEVEEKSSISEAVYECCRLAALIYSNSVIMAIPSNGGWPLRLAKQLQDHLEEIDGEATTDIYLWALHIGAMASFRSHMWPPYSKALNRAQAGNRGSWRNTDMLLEQFLWSESACSDGIALLRQSL